MMINRLLSSFVLALRYLFFELHRQLFTDLRFDKIQGKVMSMRLRLKDPAMTNKEIVRRLGGKVQVVGIVDGVTSFGLPPYGLKQVGGRTSSEIIVIYDRFPTLIQRAKKFSTETASQ